MNFHVSQIRTIDHIFGDAPSVRATDLKRDGVDDLGSRIAGSFRAAGIASLLGAASVIAFSLALGPLVVLSAWWLIDRRQPFFPGGGGSHSR